MQDLHIRYNTLKMTMKNLTMSYTAHSHLILQRIFYVKWKCASFTCGASKRNAQNSFWRIYNDKNRSSLHNINRLWKSISLRAAPCSAQFRFSFLNSGSGCRQFNSSILMTIDLLKTRLFVPSFRYIISLHTSIV